MFLGTLILTLVLAAGPTSARDDPLVDLDEPHALIDFIGPVGIDNVSGIKPLQINDRKVSVQDYRPTYAVRPGEIRLVMTAVTAPLTPRTSMSGSLRARRGKDAKAQTLVFEAELGMRYRIGGRVTDNGWEPYIASVTPTDSPVRAPEQ